MGDPRGTDATWLQHRIDKTVEFYRNRGWAKIIKVADPMTYMGVFAGQALVFEANTTSEEQFNLALIKPSRKIIKEFTASSGTGFVLIEFTSCGEIYAATLDWLDKTAAALETKCIPLDEFQVSEGFGRGLKQLTPDMCGIPVPFGLILEPLMERGRRRASV